MLWINIQVSLLNHDKKNISKTLYLVKVSYNYMDIKSSFLKSANSCQNLFNFLPLEFGLKWFYQNDIHNVSQNSLKFLMDHLFSSFFYIHAQELVYWQYAWVKISSISNACTFPNLYKNVFPCLLLQRLLYIQIGISAHVVESLCMNLLLSNTCTLYTYT